MPDTLRAVAVVSANQPLPAPPYDHAVLRHDERRVRRRMIRMQQGDEILLDFPQPVTLAHRDRLRLADGRHVEILAGDEELYEVRGRAPDHLLQLAWHIGNRHTKAEIIAGMAERDPRILILRDHVLRDMLVGLGADVKAITGPFSPMDGAYAHSHGESAHALLNR